MAKRKADQLGKPEDVAPKRHKGESSSQSKSRIPPQKKQKHIKSRSTDLNPTPKSEGTGSRAKLPLIRLKLKVPRQVEAAKPPATVQETVEDKRAPARNISNQEEQQKDTSTHSAPTANGVTRKTQLKLIAPRKPPQATRKGKGKLEVASSPPLAPPKRRRNSHIEDKIAQVLAFESGRSASTPVLTEDPEHAHHVLVSESSLIAAVMCMLVDWEMDHAEHATITGVEGAIKRKFEQPIAAGEKPIMHYSVDTKKPVALELRIHEKIDGCGLEEINLLRVELERNAIQLKEAAVNELLRLVEEAESDNEAVKGTDLGHRDSDAGVRARTKTAVRRVSGSEEVGRRGACPAHAKEAL